MDGNNYEASAEKSRLLNDLADSSAAHQQEKQDASEIREYVLRNFSKALENGWIKVYYQPVVRSVTGMICGAEALSRWVDPALGLIPPNHFIPVLEETGMVYQLDLYVIEQVCRDQQELYRLNRNQIPVSANLSRKDFHHTDIADRIEALAGKYHIPRELINIEITESAFIRYQDKLKSFINRLHEYGFQVWMDDFGTGYSSLAALKDLDFDELKIDMRFLSARTEKAKIIIRSIVSMAKAIGIQTVAEGVENESQYLFLKEIGCEKIQGYYFGKPMTRQDFWKSSAENHLNSETLRCRNYYDSLSRINYQTDEPLCVLEDDGRTFRCLYSNDRFEDALREDNFEDIHAWISFLNRENNHLHTLYRNYADEQLRKQSDVQVRTYPSEGHYMQISGNMVTHCDDNYIYAIHLRCIHLEQDKEKLKNAFYVQYFYYLYNDIVLINLQDQTVCGIKSSDYRLPVKPGGKWLELRKVIGGYTEDYIYLPDQERYQKFIDIDSIRSRIIQNHGHSISGFFRTKGRDGEYRWSIHRLMPVPGTDNMQILSFTEPVDFDKDELGKIFSGGKDGLEKLPASENTNPVKENEISDSLLWKNQTRFGWDKYFWKDRERRFIGASKSFLDFYGFSSIEEILGKTDEDMKWHVDESPFRNDEINVLEKGERVHLSVGRCIADGRQRIILADKMPIYKDGRIVGLMGQFFDAEELEKAVNDFYAFQMMDSVTGLTSCRGLEFNLKDYLEELWEKKRDFYVIGIVIPEYIPFQQNYGTKAGELLLKRIGEILRDVCGRDSVICRLIDSDFTILMQDADDERISMVCDQIRDALNKLRKVGEWHCALTADISVRRMDMRNADERAYEMAVAEFINNIGKTDKD
ncbi:MAG: EAL domain-containing protein [Eubacterium sp.]